MAVRSLKLTLIGLITVVLAFMAINGVKDNLLEYFLALSLSIMIVMFIIQPDYKIDKE